jgi:hypothetical protein
MVWEKIMKLSDFDKFVTVLFVVILGTLWLCTRRYEVPQQHRIIVYDVLGSQVNIDGIRTNFGTRVAAVSFARQYRESFPHYDFVLEPTAPLLKRGIFVRKKIQR